MNILLEFAVRLADLAVYGFTLAFVIFAVVLGLGVGALGVGVLLGLLFLVFDLLRALTLGLSGRPAPDDARKLLIRRKRRRGDRATPDGKPDDTALGRVLAKVRRPPGFEPKNEVPTRSFPLPPRVAPIKTEAVATGPDGVELTVDVSAAGKMNEVLGHLASAGFKEVTLDDAGTDRVIAALPPSGFSVGEATGALLANPPSTLISYPPGDPATTRPTLRTGKTPGENVEQA